MTQIAPRTLRRPQSLAWIAPSGEFIPIEGELMHSDLAESFPGMPPDEIYPTNYAMNHLGYLKVGNAFDFALKGDEVPRGVDRPGRRHADRGRRLRRVNYRMRTPSVAPARKASVSEPVVTG